MILFFSLTILGVPLAYRIKHKLVGIAFDGINGRIDHDPGIDYTLRNDRLKQMEIDQVEGLRESLGHLPADQQELENSLNCKLPIIWTKGRENPLRYVRISTTRYYLVYTSVDQDDWIYDSAKNDVGWFQSWD